MITYNHELFIKQAIKSVLMQKTNFKVELIIANDCSTDDTSNIIKSVINKNSFSVEVNYINRDVNFGMMPNFIDALKKCKGKYIALLDGDDYWTDPLKLQKQVDFMEANHEYGICFHNIKIYDQVNQKFLEDTITREVEETTDINELAKGNYIHTPSVMLRNDFSIPEWFKRSPLGDWALYMLTIKDRKIKRLNDVMAVYRVHDTSIWSGLTQDIRNKKTNISTRLIYNNLKLSSETKNILKSRLLKPKQKKTFINKVMNKIRNKIN